MTSPNAPTAHQSDNTTTLTLLPHTFRNQLFEQNLAFFKAQHPNLYNAVVNHQCEEYRLCSNPDDSPNILCMKNKKPLYPTFTMHDHMDALRKNIELISCHARIGDTFIIGGEERWNENNPIQRGVLDKLYKAGIFGDLKLRIDNLAPLANYKSDYFPLLRVNGIGLGYHLTQLIKTKKISYMTIYEPHLDLFFASLYTIPWNLIFKYFSPPGKSINLVIGSTPDAAISINMDFIKQRLMPLTSCFYSFNHLGSEKISEMISKEPQSDSVERQQADAGWYEDQKGGFYLSARNIKKGNKFFSGRKTKNFFRAFIIGSGPSLNETLDYIKKHQNDAIIVCCGSAITPLLKAGIIPDYEVVQERAWHYVEVEERHNLDLLKQIALLKLNVVSPSIDQYYKDVLVFQKFRDPGSSFLGDKYPVTTCVNPTVTNSGIAMCAELGVNEVYLFGVDYGAPHDHEKMHAANTIYDVLPIDDKVTSTTEFDLPGNLGAAIRTTTVLSWSLQTTKMKIAEHPEVKWFNVGEGALITGATPKSTDALPQKFSKKINKKKLLQDIAACFNNHYSYAEVYKHIKTNQMGQVDEYFDALKGFSHAQPKSREEVISVLTNLYQAVNFGHNQSHFLPTSLLSNGFKQFVTNVYIQSALAVDDDSAARFFAAAKDILFDYIDDISDDLKLTLEDIEREEEVRLLKVW